MCVTWCFSSCEASISLRRSGRCGRSLLTRRCVPAALLRPRRLRRRRLDISIHRLSRLNEWQDFHLPTCQPRLALTRFSVPAVPLRRWPPPPPLHKDYLINRIISASILPRRSDNVKREQENNQSIFAMKLWILRASAAPPNERGRCVFSARGLWVFPQMDLHAEVELKRAAPK